MACVPAIMRWAISRLEPSVVVGPAAAALRAVMLSLLSPGTSVIYPQAMLDAVFQKLAPQFHDVTHAQVRA